ncbi:MAG TPA: ATPase domain-containing protein [Spirochaetia bacterium]|nr:ATPase domain-containing protein [Spirochaetia bacterium]
MQKVSTGINALDAILGGGIPEGATVLVVGRPGSGKTIMAQQMMFHNASPENKVIYMTTLAEPQVKVLKFQQEFSYFDRSKFQQAVIYHDLGSALRKGGPSQALAVIDEVLKQHQPRLFILDAMKSLADMMPSPTDYREFLLDLSLRLATWGCTALLLGEYSEEEIEDRAESTIVDGIILLYGTEEKKHQKRYLRILKMRGTGYASGETVFRITEEGINIFPRLHPVVRNQEYIQFTGRISTGVPGLDELMDGGIPRGNTTLVSGSSGTGKTMLALHYGLAGLLAGETTVFVTFEENPSQFVGNAMVLGIDLRPYIESGHLHLIHISPIELEVDEHVFRIQKTVRDTYAGRLIIDSISSFEVGMGDKEKYTDYIWALTDFFKTQGVNVLLTHEMHEVTSVSVLTKHGISFVADNLLLLFYLEQGAEVKRFLRVLKMRGSNHSTLLRELRIGNHGLSLGETPVL